uniref:Uncharacterized protein n=1 Tax=Anguilla anguilla TaxID=7936 RepID=A0A0E9PRB0_ANGAN
MLQNKNIFFCLIQPSAGPSLQSYLALSLPPAYCQPNSPWTGLLVALRIGGM